MRYVLLALLLMCAPVQARSWSAVETESGELGWRSDRLQILPAETPRSGEQVVAIAKRFLGIPYVWAGRAPDAGFDCSGYVYEVYRLAGYELPRMADEQFYATERIQKDDLELGQLVFFETYLPGPSHVGIYVGNGEFLHSSSAREGVVVSQLRDGYYAERFLGGGIPSNWNDAPAVAAREPEPAPVPVTPAPEPEPEASPTALEAPAPSPTPVVLADVTPIPTPQPRPVNPFNTPPLEDLGPVAVTEPDPPENPLWRDVQLQLDYAVTSFLVGPFEALSASWNALTGG